VIYGDEAEVIGILGYALAQNVGDVPIGVHDANVEYGDLVNLVDRYLGRGYVVHSALAVDVLLEGPDLLHGLVGG
jgi:hypothetical protein